MIDDIEPVGFVEAPRAHAQDDYWGGERACIVVAELDAIDGTPVLDIKPVMREFLPREAVCQPAWSHELMQAYWLAKQ